MNFGVIGVDDVVGLGNDLGLDVKFSFRHFGRKAWEASVDLYDPARKQTVNFTAVGKSKGSSFIPVGRVQTAFEALIPASQVKAAFKARMAPQPV